MQQLGRKSLQIIKYSFLIVVVLLVVLITSINLPFVHSFIVKQANSYFKDNGLPIHVGSLSLSLLGNVELNEIKIIPHTADTIIYAGDIQIDIQMLPLFSKRLIVNSVSVEDVNVRLIVDSSGKLNLMALFPASTKSESDSSATSTPWEIQVDEAHLKNVRFYYSDSTNGIVFNQALGVADLNFDLFSILNKQIDIDTILIDKAIGSIDLWNVEKESVMEDSNTPTWKFSAGNIALTNILFDYKNSTSAQQATFKLNKADVEVKTLDLDERNLIVTKLSFNNPHIVFKDSQSVKVVVDSIPLNTPEKTDMPWTLACNLLDIANGYFLYDPGTAATDSTLTQWMPVQAFNTKIENLLFSSNKMGCNLKQLAFSLNNKAFVHSGELVASADTLLNGKIKLNILASVDYENSLHYIQKDTVGLSMNISGSLNSVMIDEFKIKSSSGMEIAVEGYLKNLENISETYYELLVRTSPISQHQLQGWLSIVNPELQLPAFSPASVSGKVSQTLKIPNFNLIVNSETGRVGLNGSYNLNTNYAKLDATVLNLKLKEVMGEGYPTNIFCSLSWDGVVGNLNDLNGKGELRIDSLQFKDAVAREIDLLFDAENSLSHFKILANDSALSCALNGEILLDSLNYRGKLNGEFGINNNHHDFIPGNISVNSFIDASFNLASENIESSLELSRLEFGNVNSESMIDSLVWILNMDQQSVNSQLRSDFISANFESSSSFTELQNAIINGKFNKLFSWDSTAFISKESLENVPEFNFTVDAQYDSIFMLLLPDSVFSYDNMNVKMSKVHAKQIVDLKFSVDSLNYFGVRSYRPTLDFQANENGLNGVLNVDSLNVSGVSTGKVQLKLDVLPDKMVGSITIDDSSDTPLYRLGAEAMKAQNKIAFTSSGSEWILNSETWKLEPLQFLTLELVPNDLVAGLNLNTNDYKIELNGRLSDSLKLSIKNVPIHKLISPQFISYLPNGILNVDLVYSDNEKRNLDFDIAVDDFKWNGINIERMQSNGFFNTDTLGVINSKMFAILDDSSSVSITIEPGLNPGKSNFKTTFKKIPARLSEPFIHDYVNNLDGALSGEFLVSNDFQKPDLSGKLIMESITMNVVPLNSWFSIPDDTIKVSDSHVYFNDFAIYDSLNKELFVNGNLAFTEEEEIKADLKVTTDNLLVMNTTVKDNEEFFGKVIIKSQLSIDGPVTHPDIKGNVTLSNGTNITYRQVDDVTVQETQKTVNFVNLYSDTTSSMELLTRIREISDMPSVQTTIEIDPKSRFNFDIYSGYEIHISILGSGLLNYSLLPNNTMSLTGRYEISEGTSKLKFSGWPIKNFLISKGSSMRWDGDVADPDVNLEATSKVKGSYVNPVDNKTRTVDFIVSMKLSDLVSKLKITFDVKSPDQYISSVLSSLSEDELMRQAINLLIFESINLPNIESNSNYLTSQINSFWESQLNSLSKTSFKGVDLSFGIDTYQQETASGGSEEKTSLTYEMERKILHDRASVKVSGRLNDYSEAGDQGSNLLENFSIEYELDTMDRKFLKLYTRRDYEDILDGEVTKSGVGFIYRKTYPDIKSIWRRKKGKDLR